MTLPQNHHFGIHPITIINDGLDDPIPENGWAYYIIV